MKKDWKLIFAGVVVTGIIVLAILIPYLRENVFYEDISETVSQKQAYAIAEEKITQVYQEAGFEDFTLEVDLPVLVKGQWVVDVCVICPFIGKNPGEIVWNRMENSVIIRKDGVRVETCAG